MNPESTPGPDVPANKDHMYEESGAANGDPDQPHAPRCKSPTAEQVTALEALERTLADLPRPKTD